ncbi:lipocalin-like isoform 1-T1 [Clarias gariepinus]
MAIWMLGLLGVLLFTLGTNATPNLPDFNVNKLAGKWYMSGTVSGAGWIEDPTWMKWSSVLIVTPIANAEMQMKSSVKFPLSSSKFGCLIVIHTLKKTKTPETFLLNGLYYNPSTDVTFLDVKYDEYVIIQNKRTTKENVTYNLVLYTRTPVVSKDVNKKFSQVVRKEKFDPDKTVFLPYQGTTQGECN